MWREIWRRLFDLEDDEPVERQRERAARRCSARSTRLSSRARRCSSSVLGLDIPETELTAPLDAKVRKASLEDLLADLPSAPEVREPPIILVLEDCHWIDALSRDLLEVLCRAAAALPVLIVLAYRPAPEVGGGLGIERHPGLHGDVPRRAVER